jgi:hypothetical protein
MQAIEIPPENIIIALENECAYLFCRNLNYTGAFYGGKSNSDDFFKTGSKYMIVDVGGKTYIKMIP